MFNNLHNILKLAGSALMLIPLFSFAQVSVERSVIATGGHYSEISGGFNVSATIGETFVSTMSGTISGDPYFLTQGFQQPDGMLLDPLAAASDVTESLCPDERNGTITVQPTGCLAPYTITLLKNGNVISEIEISSSAHTFTSLDSGQYEVDIRGATFCHYNVVKEVVLKNEDCDLNYYSGITPNGDGKNDFWIIDNIEINQPNEVTIFNRWGSKVWQASNYNNNDIVWSGNSQNGNILPDGTYFYTIEVPGNSDATRSGWVQVTR